MIIIATACGQCPFLSLEEDRRVCNISLPKHRPVDEFQNVTVLHELIQRQAEIRVETDALKRRARRRGRHAGKAAHIAVIDEGQGLGRFAVQFEGYDQFTILGVHADFRPLVGEILEGFGGQVELGVLWRIREHACRQDLPVYFKIYTLVPLTPHLLQRFSPPLNYKSIFLPLMAAPVSHA